MPCVTKNKFGDGCGLLHCHRRRRAVPVLSSMVTFLTSTALLRHFDVPTDVEIAVRSRTDRDQFV